MMGVFSRKKKLTKEEKETLEKAREELQKIKKHRDSDDVTQFDQENKANKESNEVKISQYQETETEKQEREFRKKEHEAVKQKEEEILAGKNTGDTMSIRTCCALDCNIEESVLDGKDCKFCNNFCCIDHLLCHKHDCIKDRHVRFIRKTGLRKYGQDVSTGRYAVVCDACGYVSPNSGLIEISGEERLSHISTKGCDSKKVFLDEK